MARTWPELFLTDDPPDPGPPGDADAADGATEPRGRFFGRLRDNMRKSREALGAELEASVFQRLDDEAFERLEETLIYADVGAQSTASIVERLETEASAGDLASGADLTRRLRELLAEAARTGDDRIDLRHQPTVIMCVGVNGTGKTTTIGKMAWHLRRDLDRSVLLAAGDTFRAAAVEQLGTWAERSAADFVRAEQGS